MKTQITLALAVVTAAILLAPAYPTEAQGRARHHDGQKQGDRPWFGRDRSDSLRMDSTQDGDGSIKESGRKDGCELKEWF